MLQVFQMNVASIYSKMFHLFQTYVCKCFDLHVEYVLQICCKSIFQMLQSYVAANVFMLQVVIIYLEVAYVVMAIHVCCKCFIWMLHMLQAYVSKCFICFRRML
jgi:hypothetical protein